MGNDNKQTYAQKKCLSKGGASCHTSNQAWRDGYDRTFRKVNNRAEAIEKMCRKDWPGTAYTDMDILPECMIVTVCDNTDNSTTPEPFRQPETDQCTKQGYISFDQWRKHQDRRTPEYSRDDVNKEFHALDKQYKSLTMKAVRRQYSQDYTE